MRSRPLCAVAEPVFADKIAAELPKPYTEDPDRAQAAGGSDHPTFPRRRRTGAT